MATSPRSMKAAVIYEPGKADVLKVETRPVPTPKSGQVLIAVKAFGLNRSELFTRYALLQANTITEIVFPAARLCT